MSDNAFINLIKWDDLQSIFHTTDDLLDGKTFLPVRPS